jgi:hypothetical protein
MEDRAMQRKIATPRLSLSRETLLQLDERSLRLGLGQAQVDSDYCTGSVRSRSGCVLCGSLEP